MSSSRDKKNEDRCILYRHQDLVFSLFHDPKQEEEVVQFISNSFVTREPLTCTIHAKVAEMTSFTRPIARQALSNLNSILCRNSEGKLIAVSLNEDLFAGEGIPAGNEEKTPFECIPEMIYRLEEQFVASLAKESLGEKKVFHVFLGATREGFEGRGIGTIMRALCCIIAKEQGYEKIMAEPTSGATHCIWVDKLGLEVFGSMMPAQEFPELWGEWKGKFSLVVGDLESVMEIERIKRVLSNKL